MDILDSSIGLEVKRITQSGPTSAHYYWNAEIHCTDEKTLTAFKVLSIDMVCDYVNNFTSEIILRLAIGGGAYTYHVYPNMARLEITLYKIPLREMGGEADENSPIQKERYTATLVKPFNPAIANNSFNQPDEVALDLTNLLEIDFQLIPKTVDQFRMRSFGGNFRNTSVEDVIKAVLTKESKLIESDTTETPVGVNMVAANNTKKRDHILIPHGTRLVDVPGYIHRHCGVYNSGMAYFFDTDIWYVFPPYNTVDFTKVQKTMTVIRIPPNRMPGNERTYIVDGSDITVIATGESSLTNKSEALMLNSGNGVRFGNADKFMEDFVKVQNNKAIAARGGSNNEFTTIARPNGRNNVLNTSVRSTSNPFLQYSELASKDGLYLSVSWENSDPTLVYPGMPVKVIFMEDDEIRETYGILLQAHHYVKLNGSGFQSRRHICTTNMTIFTRRNIAIGGDS